MTRNDDFDQTLAAWLRSQAPPQAPDWVLDAALQRVAVQSQKRSWLQRRIGETSMTIFTRSAAVIAVVALAAVIGFQFSNLTPNLGGTSPSPTIVTTPSPSATPSAEPTIVTTPSPSATPSAEPTASLPAGCVNPPTDITTLIDATQRDWTQLVDCYGNAPLTFDATWRGGGVADCPSAPEPDWLACSSFSLQALGDTRKLGTPQLFVAIDPSVNTSLSGPYAQVRVIGHFDDPAAQTCRETGSLPGESPAPVAEIIERCRNTFVITDVVELES